MCRRHAALTHAQVRCLIKSEQFDVPTCCQSTVRGRAFPIARAKRVEQSAKRRYIGLVAVSVQQHAEDILVPPLLYETVRL